MEKLKSKFNINPNSLMDSKRIKNAVKNADNIFVKIMDIKHKPENNARAYFTISDDTMHASIKIIPPIEGGIDLEYKNTLELLEGAGVKKGILEDELNELLQNPIYNENVIVAKGREARDGRDSHLIYNFKTDENIILTENKDGKVNFKELNKINNVVKDSIVARIVKASKGEDGFTVTGRVLEAKDGEEVEIKLGENVKIAENKIDILSTLNGQVILKNGIVHVDPVYVIEQNVNLKTGNIFFLGSVIVKGNVEDGFTVKASGNIEIHGHATKCKIESDGDIIIHEGIAGKGGGVINAKGDFMAKFVENATVNCKGDMLISDGIINSTVICYKRILCKGKRATVVGGKTIASKGLYAKNIGSIAGVETIVETGYDIDKRSQLEELSAKVNEDKLKMKMIKEELEDLKVEINSYDFDAENKKKTKAINKSNENKKKIRILKKEIRIGGEKIEALKQEEIEYAKQSKISAESFIYAGVKLIIRDQELMVRSDNKSVTVKLENKEIKVGPYEGIEKVENN